MTEGSNAWFATKLVVAPLGHNYFPFLTIYVDPSTLRNGYDSQCYATQLIDGCQLVMVETWIFYHRHMQLAV